MGNTYKTENQVKKKKIHRKVYPKFRHTVFSKPDASDNNVRSLKGLLTFNFLKF